MTRWREKNHWRLFKVWRPPQTVPGQPKKKVPGEWKSIWESVVMHMTTRRTNSKGDSRGDVRSKWAGFSPNRCETWEILTEKFCIHTFKWRQGSGRKESAVLVIRCLPFPPSSAQDFFVFLKLIGYWESSRHLICTADSQFLQVTPLDHCVSGFLGHQWPNCLPWNPLSPLPMGPRGPFQL